MPLLHKPAVRKCPRCSGSGTTPLPVRSSTNYIPKAATVLTLIKDITARGEQVIVFSAFNEPNEHLSQRLREAGVRHFLLDGNSSQKKRGAAAVVFKAGRRYYTDPAGRKHSPVPVTLAGVDSMAEGHSFHRCNNAILYCYSWAMDKFKQALDRVHRLNSETPINVYVVFCDGTIDQRLESLTDEKTDSSDLVLDGALMGERGDEVNFAELHQIARHEFDTDRNGETVDETRLLAEWPSLMSQLRSAQNQWDQAISDSSALRKESAQKSEAVSQLFQTAIPAPRVLPDQSPHSSPQVSHSPAWINRYRSRAGRLAQLQAA